MNACLYHNDKEYFMHFVKCLRQQKFLNKQQASQFAMTVCGCRKTNQSSIPNEDELRVITDRISACLSLPEHHYEVIFNYLADYLHGDIKSLDVSRLRLLYVMDLVLRNDLALLTKESRKMKQEKSVEESYYLTGKQFKLMLLKWKKKCKIDVTLTFDFDPRYMYLLRSHTADHFITIGKEFGCFIQQTKCPDYVYKSYPKLSLRVQCPSREILEKVKSSLTEKILAASKEIRKPDRRRHYDIIDGETSDHDSDTLKDTNTDCFARRSTAHSKRVPKFSPVKLGHCLHCLKAHNKNESECRYHSGYIVTRYEWSCCSADASSSHAKHEDHNLKGCVKHRHIWRREKPTKKPRTPKSEHRRH